MRTKKIVIVAGVSILLAFGAYFGQKYCVGFQKARQQKILYASRKAAWQELAQRLGSEIRKFKGKPGIVIKDLQTGWQFSYNETALFPSASLAKIPLMSACFFASDQGRINLGRTVALKSADKLTGSGVLKVMAEGTMFTVERLLGLMIYDSDNTATNIITNLLGIDYLNDVFKRFGLRNTELSRKIADYRTRDKGIENYTTAQDMAFLLEKIYRRTLGKRSVSDASIAMLKLTRSNDRIPKYLPPELTIAHKTGLEKGVCHDAGIVFTKKGDFIICVLTKHANANSVASKEFIAKVALQAYSYFKRLP